MHSIASPVLSLPICPVTARNIMPGVIFPDLFHREHHQSGPDGSLHTWYHIDCPRPKGRQHLPNCVDDTDTRLRTHLSALIRDNVYNTPPTILRGIVLALNPIFIVLSTHIVRLVRERRTGTVWTLPLTLLLSWPIWQSGICYYRTCFRQGTMSVDRRTWSGGVDEGPNDPLYPKPALSYKDRTLVVYLPLFGSRCPVSVPLHVVPTIRVFGHSGPCSLLFSQPTYRHQVTNNRHGGP
jgi:hypothetical protein